MDNWYVYILLLAAQVIAVTICVAHAISKIDLGEKSKGEEEEEREIVPK